MALLIAVVGVAGVVFHLQSHFVRTFNGEQAQRLLIEDHAVWIVINKQEPVFPGEIDKCF